ncbi:MAG: hypothetical protein ACOX6S_10145 [Clostridia bacterium]|jgi:hypothetical protein
MTYRMKDCIQQGICALLPVYDAEGGNCTRILCSDQQERMEGRVIKTVLRDIAAFYHMDIGLIRRKYGELIGCRNTIPLPFTPELILVPFKVRQPLGTNDGAYGYFSYLTIEGALAKGATVFIQLTDGREIPILESMRCYRNRMKNADIIRSRFLENFLSGSVKEVLWWEGGNAYRQPATRGDILLMASNLMNLMAQDKNGK